MAGPSCGGLKNDPMKELLERGAALVLAAAGAMPEREDIAAELAAVEAAEQRGYFLPDEEERIRFLYPRHLGLRAALLEMLESLGDPAGRGEVGWRDHLPVFVTAFAATCLLTRADRFLVDLAAERPVLWKKLDEEDLRTGIPRKSFTGIFKEVSHPLNAGRFLMAVDFYENHRAGIRELAADPLLGPVVELLEKEEAYIGKRRRDVFKRFLDYRWFSFLRRNRSAWKKVMAGLFEASGRAVADLRQPGIKPSGAAKRVTAEMREEVLRQVGPGDVFVTRHDDALSNLFLPGYWPHAALYIGTTEELEKIGIGTPGAQAGQAWFLESKKDGVRIRPAEETLEVDAFVILRHPLERELLVEALRRAVSHAGKPYDFLFDFRTADRMVCTEVIYRGFHGIGPVKFHLKEVGGRLCLPAEEFLDQALECGYQIIGTGGLDGDGLLFGEDGLDAFGRTYSRRT